VRQLAAAGDTVVLSAHDVAADEAAAGPAIAAGGDVRVRRRDVAGVSSETGSLALMGGPGVRPVADGAASVCWAVDLPDGRPTGGFFSDGNPLAW
jgi:hypothetical protein